MEMEARKQKSILKDALNTGQTTLPSFLKTESPSGLKVKTW